MEIRNHCHRCKGLFPQADYFSKRSIMKALEKQSEKERANTILVDRSKREHVYYCRGCLVTLGFGLFEDLQKRRGGRPPLKRSWEETLTTNEEMEDGSSDDEREATPEMSPAPPSPPKNKTPVVEPTFPRSVVVSRPNMAPPFRPPPFPPPPPTILISEDETPVKPTPEDVLKARIKVLLARLAQLAEKKNISQKAKEQIVEQLNIMEMKIFQILLQD